MQVSSTVEQIKTCTDIFFDRNSTAEVQEECLAHLATLSLRLTYLDKDDVKIYFNTISYNVDPTIIFRQIIEGQHVYDASESCKEIWKEIIKDAVNTAVKWHKELSVLKNVCDFVSADETNYFEENLSENVAGYLLRRLQESTCKGENKQEYLRQISSIAAFIGRIWKQNEIIFESNLHDIIKTSYHHSASPLAAVVAWFPTKHLTNNIASHTDLRELAKYIERGLPSWIQWLAWPGARNVDVFLHAVMEACAVLEDKEKIKIINTYTDQLTKILKLIGNNLHRPGPRMKVLCHICKVMVNPDYLHHEREKILDLFEAADEAITHSVIPTNVEKMRHKLQWCRRVFETGNRDPADEAYENSSDEEMANNDADVSRNNSSEKPLALATSGREANRTTKLKYPTRPVGLANFGNACYANAVIQLLFMCDGFVEDVLRTPSKNSVFEELKKLFKDMHNKQDLFADAHNFTEATFNGDFVKWKQQDSCEYMRHVLDLLSVTEPNTVASNFHSNILDSYICEDCGQVMESNDIVVNIPLEVPLSKFSLESQIESYMEPPICSTYDCRNKCHGEREFQINRQFQKLPRFLPFSLNRFTSCHDIRVKKSTEVSFDIDILKLSEIERGSVSFYLAGIICHHGSADVGHYYTIARHSESADWYELNGASVSKFGKSKVLKQGHNVCLLMYAAQSASRSTSEPYTPAPGPSDNKVRIRPGMVHLVTLAEHKLGIELR